jgi:hypothetical protein
LTVAWWICRQRRPDCVRDGKFVTDEEIEAGIADSGVVTMPAAPLGSV